MLVEPTVDNKAVTCSSLLWLQSKNKQSKILLKPWLRLDTLMFCASESNVRFVAWIGWRRGWTWSAVIEEMGIITACPERSISLRAGTWFHLLLSCNWHCCFACVTGSVKMWELCFADLPAVPAAQADNMPGSYKGTEWLKRQWYVPLNYQTYFGYINWWSEALFCCFCKAVQFNSAVVRDG